MRALAFLLLCSAQAAVHGAGLPPAVEAVMPRLGAVEQRLQEATLAHEAARREALPAEAAVAEARRGQGSWWGDRRLRRALARFKDRLDAVEQARRIRADAREDLFVMLTAAEEELRSALEKGLAAGRLKAEAEPWWQRLQAWSRRLEALESAPGESQDAGGADRRRLLAQARLEQIERDRRLLAGLTAARLLSRAEAEASRSRLRGALQRWKRLAAGSL